MLGGLIALGACTCSIRAVDKMMIIMMSAKVTKSIVKLSYKAYTNFIVDIKIRFRQGENIFKSALLNRSKLDASLTESSRLSQFD